MEHFVIIPPHLIISLLKKRISAAAAERKVEFLLDEFPRSTEQAPKFENKVRINMQRVALNN